VEGAEFSGPPLTPFNAPMTSFNAALGRRSRKASVRQRVTPFRDWRACFSMSSLIPARRCLAHGVPGRPVALALSLGAADGVLKLAEHEAISHRP